MTTKRVVHVYLIVGPIYTQILALWAGTNLCPVNRRQNHRASVPIALPDCEYILKLHSYIHVNNNRLARPFNISIHQTKCSKCRHITTSVRRHNVHALIHQFVRVDHAPAPVHRSSSKDRLRPLPVECALPSSRASLAVSTATCVTTSGDALSVARC